MQTAWPITWSSNTKYVDIDTGEEITKHQSKEYLKLKKDKYVKLNKNKTSGHIEYTIKCRKHPQGKLFDS